MSDIVKPCCPVLCTLAALVVIASMLPTAQAQFLQQGSKLVGTGAVGAAQQGGSVALSGDGNTAIIGGNFDNTRSGATWVFTRSGGVWTQQGGKLVGAGAVVGSSTGVAQGASVALSGDGNTAIIGAPGDNTDAGAAWVFTRSSGVWSQQGAKLVGADAVGDARQGYSVALSADGNTAVVGGWGDNSGAGAVWVFTRSNGVWIPQGAKLVGTGAVGTAWQGNSVALSSDGNTAIVGGWLDNGYVGATWVFTRSGGVWSQQGAKLVGTGAAGAAWQGDHVALSGDGNTAILGGPGDNSGPGAAWIFTRSGGVWTQQGGKLLSTGIVGSAQIGSSVALSGDGNMAVIGGMNDNAYAGAAWVFTRSGGVWAQQGSKLVGAGAVGTAKQGASVGLAGDGNTVIVGGPTDNQVGVGSVVGAAWVFAATPTTPAKPTVTGVVNDASFTAGGAVSTGSWVAIFGTGLAPAGDSRKWNEATEIVNGKLPTNLDGTSVTVNGKPAAIEFIQPSQVNIQPPDDTALGPVQVIVNTAAGATDAFIVNYATFAPGLFAASAPYIVAQHADNSYVTTTAPAKPGEVIILWGTGFGPANPGVPAGQVFSGANRLANTVTVMIGGQPAAVDFAGVIGAGLVQINVHVPSSIGSGDAGVVASVGGVSTQTTANMIPIHN
jgi:uncharacterized protein (TIGR03437 family)